MGDRRWDHDSDKTHNHEDVQKDVGNADYGRVEEVSFDDPIPQEPDQPQDADDE